MWELIPGGDEELYTLGSYVTPRGDALAVFTGRKVVQDPPGVGTARVAESVWVPELVDLGLTLLRGLGCHGPSQVEFERDPRDGVFKLIEVNPRLWQWHGLTGACGVDVALTAYRDLVGETTPATFMRPIRKRWAITFKVDRPAAAAATAVRRPAPPARRPPARRDAPRPLRALARRFADRPSGDCPPRGSLGVGDGAHSREATNSGRPRRPRGTRLLQPAPAPRGSVSATAIT